MSKVYEHLDERLIAFIRAQKLFFVATAPLSAAGRINLSPKGYDSLAIIDPLTVAYIDLGGSGIETHAHVKENGRITLMFCAFEGAAKILRLYGRAEAMAFYEPGFDEAMARFPSFARARGVITVHIDRIADSCGWGVPFFDYAGERDQLKRWIAARPEEEWRAHRLESNALSIDGLAGLGPTDQNFG